MRYKSVGLRPVLSKRTLEYLASGAPEGRRNAELFDAACQFRDAGFGRDEAEAQLLGRALADGLREAEARQAIRSAFGQVARPPISQATPRAAFMPHGGTSPGFTIPQANVLRPVPLPAPMEQGFTSFLDACFQLEEHVAIAPACEDAEGNVIPRRGVSLSAAQWKERVLEKGGIDRCFSTKVGLFIRVNAVRPGGARNEDVTSFRHCLVEFDRNERGEAIPKDLQYGAILASGLPVSAVIDSGNKSIHAWVRVDAPDAGEYRRRVDVVWEWFTSRGCPPDGQNKNPSRLSRCPDGWRTVQGELRRQELLALAIGAGSWSQWERDHANDGLPRIVAGTDFMATPSPEPPQLVTGILHQGCKMIVGGASKARKSWTLIDLTLSVSTGGPWWGFPTQHGRVLYVNFELPDFAFQHRLRGIAAAKGIKDFSGFDLWNLRGYATDFSVLIPKILARIKDGRYALIVLDPIYKGLGRRDENKAGDIASLCNEIEQLAVKSGAAVVFGAHYSKGNQAGKDAIDRIGGSGVFARDPDVILTMTPHEEKDAYVVDLTLRALPQVEPFVVRWQGVQFHRDDAADPGRLRAPGAGAASKPSKASYKAGSIADRYAAVVEKMPPLKHDKDPSFSEVVHYICERVAQLEGECSLAQGSRIYHAFACMNSRGNRSPIIFDRSTRLWRGRNYAR